MSTQPYMSTNCRNAVEYGDEHPCDECDGPIATRLCKGCAAEICEECADKGKCSTGLIHDCHGVHESWMRMGQFGRR
jgi:hypothetical protein